MLAPSIRAEEAVPALVPSLAIRWQAPPSQAQGLGELWYIMVDLYGNSWGYNGKCGNSQEFIGMNGDFHGEATPERPEDDSGPKWSHKTADV